MFEKTLQDLVKGIRANKRDPGAFISQAIAEIKVELKNVDPFIKVSSSSSQELCSALLHFLSV
jgi:AP-3 complex subunit delta